VLPDIDLPSAVDPGIIGESSRERALPWDQIKATGFQAGQPLDSEIAFLTQYQIDRMQSDPDIRYLVSDIAAIEELRSQKSVPLNLESRKIERQIRKEERLRRENERRQALNLDPLESLDDIDMEEQPDILLDQAAQIVLDLVVLESPDASMLTRATGT
jgi:carboxyl-terminal processing protease